MQERVLGYAEALEAVLARAREFAPPGERETVALAGAVGRVLAAPVLAERDQPPFDRSTRDGYAVQAADVRAGARLRLLGSVRAGEQWRDAALQAGEAIEVMTGAPMPAGADAMLMVEHTTSEAGAVVVGEGRTLRAGDNVVRRAAEASAGAALVPTGRRVGVAEIATAASCGYAELEVFARPRVAIIATGDELVELDTAPEAWQIRNSNSYALAALVRGAGGEPLRLPIARDTREALRARVAEGRRADLLLLSGGVSKGKYDLVEEVLGEYGAAFDFTGALIQPGKPVVFGRLPKGQGTENREQETGSWTPLFGLPGNPVSTEVCFRLFVEPLLRALGGEADPAPQFAQARLAEDVRGGPNVTRFLPARLISNWQGAEVRLVPWQGSGDLAANARANCFAVLPIGTDLRASDAVRVLLR